MERAGEAPTRAGTTADGLSRHWDDYYRRGRPPEEPSPFAHAVVRRLRYFGPQRIVDLACGNGRDSRLLADAGHDVLGVDRCDEALKAASSGRVPDGLRYASCDLADVDAGKLLRDRAVAYVRWGLHAVTQQVQDVLLRRLAASLSPPGLLFVEARSASGLADSHLETNQGHYRRLIHPESLDDELRAAGFDVLELSESEEYARSRDSAPLVLRVTARARRRCKGS